MFKEIIANNLEDEKQYRSIFHICLFILSVIMLFSILVFYYTDIMDTLDNSVLLVEAITKGQFFDYYHYATIHAYTDTIYTANYNILVYAVFAIWNLPIALIHLLTEFDYMINPISIVWCKLLIVLSLISCGKSIYQIILFQTKDRKFAQLSAFIFLSSTPVWIAAICAVQYDCIMLALVLRALYLLADKKEKTACLLFSLAVPFKLFAVFILVPVTFIYRKRIYKAAQFIVAAMVPSFLLELPFRNDPYFRLAMNSQNGDGADIILDGAKIGGINLFVLLYICICVICLIIKLKNEQEKQYFSVYISFLIFASFLTLTPVRSYWIILYMPFVAILICSRIFYRELKILLALFTGAFGSLYFLIHHWIYSTPVFCRYLLLRYIDIPDGREFQYDTIIDMAEAVGIMKYKNILLTLFFAGLLLMAFLCVPNLKIMEKEKNQLKTKKLEILYMPLHLAILVVFLGIILYSSLKTQPTVCGGFLTRDEASYEYTKIDQKGLSQKLSFDEARDLSYFEIPVIIEHYYRSNRTLLCFQLIDETGNCVWRNDIGMTEAKDGYLKIRIHGVSIEPNRPYELIVSRVDTTHSYDTEAFVQLDKDNNVCFSFR